MAKAKLQISLFYLKSFKKISYFLSKKCHTNLKFIVLTLFYLKICDILKFKIS
ncbi:hypothetical protein UNSW3_104 [Campylobacter concisus UNSW3]|uniref:Uncharacterized protein n=1 Tax=Campylobacter concisus UNSW3 TaxID=1242966 RepID=U2EDI8_9BACT|nr:hypothetical protein UNSW3_104 [Campylobacter concisus UNSW3]